MDINKILDLGEIRERIDKLDKQLVELLEERLYNLKKILERKFLMRKGKRKLLKRIWKELKIRS